MKKTIALTLSESGVESAIREVQQYKKEFIQKAVLFRDRVAEEIQKEAQQGFDGAIVDDLIGKSGKPIQASVQVSVNPGTGDVTTVIASGEDAVWVEFGAGVYHNGSAGSSPHPDGAALGMTIGSYGEGNGKKKTWGYYNGDQLILTHGTPAKMPMYNAMKDVADRINDIAKEVFG